MSIRCSIFGHKYGDPEVDREREEDGSEVIITIRETEQCERCGEVRVVSENKEVTTLETAADIVAEDLAEEEADAPEAESAPGADEADEGAPQADAGPAIQDAETGEQVTATAQRPAQEAAEDDGVILEEEQTGEPEGQSNKEREPGEWPEEPDDADDDWEPETSPERESADQGPNVEPTGSAVTVPEGTFYCPECGFSTPVDESSLREGDFCPECHRGSLEHRSE